MKGESTPTLGGEMFATRADSGGRPPFSLEIVTNQGRIQAIYDLSWQYFQAYSLVH